MNEVCGMIAAVGFCISYIPQMIRMYQTKRSNSVSALMYWIGLFCYVCNLVYLQSIDAFWVQFSAWICLGFVVVIIGQIIFYRKNNNQ